jgi:3'-phosphoadenosine 5'-phosphosulfate sulfotransferase (PAPS reductase)/FAD synthetase
MSPQLDFFGELTLPKKTKSLENPRQRFVKAFSQLTEKASLEDIEEDAEKASILMIHRLCDAAVAAGLQDKAGILVNSSTGKDSTLVTQLVVTTLARRKKDGKAILPVFVGIADTASEFAMMADRMTTEAAAINRFGRITGTPIEAEIVKPDPGKRLLVEILGRGLGLPHLKSGTNNGLSGASWCMDRVKKAPLEQVFKKAEKKFPFLIQCVGVREAESSRRAGKIQKHACDLPDGLTELGTASPNHIGATPIRHWSDNQVRDWMNNHLPPWNPGGSDELRKIYSLGANAGGESGECQLSIAKDGSITNVCSDLGGTRFGCWHCLLSKNKSLANISRRDTSYKPLRRFHTYLFGHHRRGDRRRELRESAGYSALHMFPKGFTLRERFFMSMLIARAEVESGHTLLAPEEIEAIETRWAVNGYPQLTFALARSAAEQWRKTGKPLCGWETGIRGHNGPAGFEPDMTATAFATPLPYAAWAHLPDPEGRIIHEGRAPDVLNLLSAAGCGEELFPTLKAWVLVAPRLGTRTRHILTIITDNLSALAGRTQGMVTGHWVIRGSRPVLPWERALSDGRTVFHTLPETTIPEPWNNKGLAMLANFETDHHCNGTRAFEDNVLQNQRISECRITPQELDQLMRDIATASWDADVVATAVTEAKCLLSSWNSRNGFPLPDNPEARGLKNPAEFKELSTKLTKVRAELREVIEAHKVHKAAWNIQNAKKLACRLMLEGRINRSLLNRLDSHVPWISVDPDEFEKEFSKTARMLGLPDMYTEKTEAEKNQNAA